MKKVLPVITLVIIVVGVFYGGVKYAQSEASQGFGRGNFQELRNLSPEERQQMGMADMSFGAGRPENRIYSDSVTGKIISKDNQSITVKLWDGGSKIIFYSEDTEIGKFVNGISDDIEVGKSVLINGKANEDGSITAALIQLRLEITPAQ